MKNSDRYHFADFTRDNYLRLLKIAQRQFTFCSFHNIPTDGDVIILRHDVDMSPHAARHMGRIEADLGIQATYFVSLHSEFYNLLEKEITDCIRELINMGHYLGLHFDCHYYKVTEELQLEELIIFEREIIERIFPSRVHAVSFHNPSITALENFTNSSYAGLFNTYARYFQENFSYLSDSNGYWRHRSLEEVLLGGQDHRLHILLHPEMWQDEVMSPKHRIHRCIDGRAQKTKRFYDELLKTHGRKNIDRE